jgi:cytochrome P450
MDPPELTNRRRVMSHAFTPRAIGKLEEGIRARAASMIDRLLDEGGGDWIGDVADVLPMTVIGDIIGIPEQDRPHIFDTLDRILKANAPGGLLTGQEHLELFGSIFSYALELTEQKRRSPADDIWSTLTSAVITDESGQQLSIPANELEIFFFVLAFAGSDTTKNALAAGLQAFVDNPAQIERYRADEAVRPGAVEEVLRWSTPVTYWTRTTKVDVQIDDVTIPTGARVVAMLRSANRDEEIFADPFTFDIGRVPNPHVAFGGGGPHHCLGAMLARTEIRAVFDELLIRAGDIALGPPKVAYPSLVNNMYIFDEMAISLTPR